MKLRATILLILIPLLVYTQQTKEPAFHIWDKGYCNFTSFGYLIGSGQDEKTFVPSLQMEHNYRFNKNFAFGLYTGADCLDITVATIGPHLKIFFPHSNNKTSLFIGSAIGGSLVLKDKKIEHVEITDTGGGRFANIEIGISIRDKSKIGFFVASGYRHQQISYTLKDSRVNSINKAITYNRFVLKFGIRI
ncbi:hypothetical protein SAMN06265379_101747 [Saccharicrinis carchari]|uniref:Outer membrane protein beta-barrel domain-containing protein n=1 Tax=Saccharicrinis carchari TaxID=1168039 RepID=A0A521B6E0_SACCC|nr:hypothetical protein [Saccharicrinis carchari]SMO42674.1 hypothetical protein SAMN06265379_101747 [Saccharicrinis carchari]